jgi:AcrR family transcriptional regulator
MPSAKTQSGVGKSQSQQESGTGRTRSRERYEKRRAEVVDIAARLFAQQGFHATSIDDLVEATGLQRGGLYHYMDGKKDLLSRIHQRFLDPLLAEAERIIALEEPPDVTLQLLARALMNDIATYTDQVTVFLHEWRYIQDAPEWAEIRKARRRFENYIENTLKAGQASGLFQLKNAHVATLGFLGMINYTYQWYRPGGAVKPQDIADQFCGIFLNGIRAD